MSSVTDPRPARRAPLGHAGRTFLAVAGVELRRWRRHRTAVATALVLPVGMAALVSQALGGEMPEFTTTFAVVDLDQGPVGDAYVDQGLGHPSLASLVEVRPVESRAAAGRLLDQDEVDLVVVLPEQLSEATLAGRAADIEVRGGHPVARDLANLVEDQFMTQAHASAIALDRTGSAPTTDWPLTVTVAAPGGQRLDAARHYGPGIGMFFLLVTLGFAAQRALADRRRGLADRLDAAPVAPTAVLAGRVVAALAVGALSMTTTALAMQFLFGRSWGPLVPVAALIIAVVLAMGGIAALLAAFSRTPEQAQSLVTTTGFVFALAGGTFAPPGAAGPRSSLAVLAPTTHALDGFAVLATERASLGTIGGSVLVLLAFGVVGTAAAALSARRAG